MVAIDMSAAKAPPRKRASTTATRPAKAEVVTQPDSPLNRRAEGLSGLFQLAQGFCLMTNQYADAATIGQHHAPICIELAKLSDQYEWLAKPVDLLIEVGPFTALLAAALPMTLQLMANHGRLDASKFVGQGIVPPEVLHAQMQANVARMQAEAMREQQRALAEAQKA